MTEEKSAGPAAPQGPKESGASIILPGTDPLAEKKLDSLIAEAVPEPKQERFKREIYEFFKMELGVFHGQPRLDPDVVRIIAATTEKDNENKFQYIKQKQLDATELAKLRISQQEKARGQRVKMLWPILVSAIVAELGLLAVGVAFVAKGKEAIGIGFITAVLASTFGYLGGLGTAHFFKPDSPQGGPR